MYYIYIYVDICWKGSVWGLKLPSFWGLRFLSSLKMYPSQFQRSVDNTWCVVDSILQKQTNHPPPPRAWAQDSGPGPGRGVWVGPLEWGMQFCLKPFEHCYHFSNLFEIGQRPAFQTRPHSRFAKFQDSWTDASSHVIIARLVTARLDLCWCPWVVPTHCV